MDKELTIEVNIPESFIRNIKCRSALSEYNDWVEYLKKELENLYRDTLRNGIMEELYDENELEKTEEKT